MFCDAYYELIISVRMCVCDCFRYAVCIKAFKVRRCCKGSFYKRRVLYSVKEACCLLEGIN